MLALLAASAATTTATVGLLASNGATVAVVLGILLLHRKERQEWAAERKDSAAERRQLIDRIIARHTGEVIALDRAEKVTPKAPEPERLVEGLS